MLKAKFDSVYRKSNKVIGVYTVSGTPEELASFKEAKGDYYRENDKGLPLHFVTNPKSEADLSLLVTTNNKIVVKQSVFEMLHEDAADVKAATEYFGCGVADATTFIKGNSVVTQSASKRALEASNEEEEF